jgi:hypothetical protein
MRRAFAIVKYVPTVLCGLLVMRNESPAAAGPEGV